MSSSLDEPETASQRTENVPSISDRDFSDISEKIEKSVCRKIKDTAIGQREILKMIGNLSSKIDSLSGQTPRIKNLEVDHVDTENQASITIHMPQRTSKILLVWLTANRNALLFLIRDTSFARYTV